MSDLANPAPADEAAATPPVDTTPPATPTEPQEAPTDDFKSNPDVIAYIDEQVNLRLNKALQGKTPKASTVDPTAAERTEFDRMTYKQRNQLFHSNPQAYHKLAKGSV